MPPSRSAVLAAAQGLVPPNATDGWTALITQVGWNPIPFWLPVNAHLGLFNSSLLELYRVPDVGRFRVQGLAKRLAITSLTIQRARHGVAFLSLVLITPDESLVLHIPRTWKTEGEQLISTLEGSS